MPAVSKAQRRLFAIAEHHPDELKNQNSSLLKLSKNKLHEFAATSEKKLPLHKKVARRFLSLRRKRNGS